MSTKKSKELASLTVDELNSRAREGEANLFKLKMQKKTGQLSDTASMWRERKQLARVKTLQAQKKTLH